MVVVGEALLGDGTPRHGRGMSFGADMNQALKSAIFPVFKAQMGDGRERGGGEFINAGRFRGV